MQNKSIKKQQETTLLTAQFITLLSGLIMFSVAFVKGSQLTMDNPVKENMVIVMLFACIVSLFSIISIITNKN
jgi:hydrogenase-4 membrane subunit HyfE|tara:strand:+ start:35 stop:253 length:219 start_codon:yes stop_codon:yes gene_type:complete